jgi:DNA-directed RNA polymerase specialized sigma24 family protein
LYVTVSAAAPTDGELLGSPGRDAFGTFYDRHTRAIMEFFVRRTRDPESAADLTAETFAAPSWRAGASAAPRPVAISAKR